VSEWSSVWLAVIAISVALMAAIQIGAILIAIKLGRQLAVTTDELRKEIRPLMDKMNRVADEAVRTTALAAAQVERVDRLLATTAVRVEEAVSILRNAMGGPVRQGAAAFMAVRAVIGAFRQWQNRGAKGATRDDEDALFVG
jgi:uncharacterized membrane protein YczE